LIKKEIKNKINVKIEDYNDASKRTYKASLLKSLDLSGPWS